MNPHFHVEGMQTKVCKETENIFNEVFWTKQDFIIYAVDSVDVRKYIESKVVLFQKPAADSGTLGTKVQSQIIIPHQTLTYNDKAPPAVVQSIPACSLRHFPSFIQNCIEWSRDSFSGYFGNVFDEIQNFY